jgi:hypothetical protein
MRFYEQEFDGRTIISANIELATTRVMRDIEADCWIDAKRRFGYMLSAAQEWLLDKFYKKREEVMRGITKI